MTPIQVKPFNQMHCAEKQPTVCTSKACPKEIKRAKSVREPKNNENSPKANETLLLTVQKCGIVYDCVVSRARKAVYMYVHRAVNSSMYLLARLFVLVSNPSVEESGQHVPTSILLAASVLFS